MKLTESIIDDAVHGDPFAMEFILEFYDLYLQSLAQIEFFDHENRFIGYYDPDVKHMLQQKILKEMPKFVYRPK